MFDGFVKVIKENILYCVKFDVRFKLESREW